MAEVTQFESHLEFVCPFCGGMLMAGYVQPVNLPTVIHSDPMCKEFEEIDDPTDFLKKSRKKMGIPDAPDENN
jgi:hypothetical protein